MFASIFLANIENAPNDFVISSEEGDPTVGTAIREHRVQLRTLVAGVPATIVGIGTTASSFFP